MGLFQQKVPVLHNRELGPAYFRMGIAFPELAEKALPGQFVMVKVSSQTLPLLRRPFSIHRPLVDRGVVQGFELLYKVVGEGTRRLSELRPGDSIDVLGPLGKGFSCAQGVRRVWVVAGGVGVASLYFLVLNLSHDAAVHITVFIGGCSAADILCEKELRAMGAEVRVTTEDCTLGETGLVTSMVERFLGEEKKPDMIYGCGPQGMLKAVGQIAAAYLVPCQISLESAMACGFGVCLGCAVEKEKVPGTYFHVCTDGPVFDVKDVRI